MKIKSGGNVGIGETNPSYLLNLKNLILIIGAVQGGNAGTSFNGTEYFLVNLIILMGG